MRRLLLILALTCAAWPGAVLSSEAALPEPLQLFVADQAAPKMFIQDHKPVGYMTELAVEALQRAGYEVEVQAYPWARTVSYAQAGFGVITSFSRTPERNELYLFSTPIYEDRVLMITRQGAGLQLNGLSDLAGLHAGVQQGASFGPDFETALPTINVQWDANASSRLQKLVAGRIDVAILSGGPPAVRHYATRAGIDLSLLEVQENHLVVDANHIAVARSREDAHDIIRRINVAIESMLSDGTSSMIIGRYE